MMKNQQIIIIVVVIAVVIAIIIAMMKSKKESYAPSTSAKFEVNRPKYKPPQPTSKMPMMKEGFIVPIPQESQTLKSSYLGGSSNTPISNPFLGGLPMEASLGVSTPGAISATMLSGNGQNDLNSVANVWKTVL